MSLGARVLRRAGSARKVLGCAIAETLEPRLLLAGFGPVGVEFRVNTTTNGLQSLPSIATDADGDSVVVWNGNGPGDAHGIFAQRLAADGTPLGAEFRVNPAIAGQQHGHRIESCLGRCQQRRYFQLHGHSSRR